MSYAAALVKNRGFKPRKPANGFCLSLADGISYEHAEKLNELRDAYMKKKDLHTFLDIIKAWFQITKEDGVSDDYRDTMIQAASLTMGKWAEGFNIFSYNGAKDKKAFIDGLYKKAPEKKETKPKEITKGEEATKAEDAQANPEIAAVAGKYFIGADSFIESIAKTVLDKFNIPVKDDSITKFSKAAGEAIAAGNKAAVTSLMESIIDAAGIDEANADEKGAKEMISAISEIIDMVGELKLGQIALLLENDMSLKLRAGKLTIDGQFDRGKIYLDTGDKKVVLNYKVEGDKMTLSYKSDDIDKPITFTLNKKAKKNATADETAVPVETPKAASIGFNIGNFMTGADRAANHTTNNPAQPQQQQAPGIVTPIDRFRMATGRQQMPIQQQPIQAIPVAEPMQTGQLIPYNVFAQNNSVNSTCACGDPNCNGAHLPPKMRNVMGYGDEEDKYDPRPDKTIDEKVEELKSRITFTEHDGVEVTKSFVDALLGGMLDHPHFKSSLQNMGIKNPDTCHLKEVPVGTYTVPNDPREYDIAFTVNLKKDKAHKAYILFNTNPDISLGAPMYDLNIVKVTVK